MNDLEKQRFYCNLSYPSQSLAKEILKSNKITKSIFNLTTMLTIISFLIGIIFLSRFSKDDFIFLVILLIILLICNFIYKPLDNCNSKFKTIKNKLTQQINSSNFCTCSDKCNCKNDFIKFMKEKKRIKLY